MKASCITLMFLIVLSNLFTAQNKVNFSPLIYTGKIDTYAIQLEITSYDIEKGTFEGRYKYASQKKYITLKGEVNYTCLFIEEFDKGVQTHEFYLEMDGKNLNGFWTSESKTRKVELRLARGDLSKWTFKTLEDLSVNVTNSINGSYGNESYWINDYFATPDNPSVEIGFNGGYAVFKKVGADSLEFQLEVICGPTYHFAYAGGMAVKQDSVYKYVSMEYATEDSPCEITITFSEKQVHVSANQSMDCGFGARAYLDHYFVKISESTLMNEDISLSTLKGK
jgi:hypothetical protein